MLLNLTALIAGLVLLAGGSDRFVLGAASVARHLGVTPMVVGLTVVAVGTSAPEMLVSGMAALQGNPGIAIGNVLGSNVANMTLVVGVSALVVPLLVASRTLRREFPILFAVTALAWVLCLDGVLDRLDGALLMVAMVVVLWLIVRQARAARRSDPLRQELDVEMAVAARLSTSRAALFTGLGLLALLAGSKLVVFGASELARAYGVSDLVIGLSIVAVGTSLPELAASVASALKGEPDMAVGNVLGSNLFNLLPVLGIAGLVQPFGIEREALQRDFPVMVALTVVLYLLCLGWGRGAGQVSRLGGAVLLLVFVGYQGALYLEHS
jgi:cation:H+ antiporter